MTSAALLPPPTAEARRKDDLVHSTPRSDPDPFRYGWRFERVKTADGEYDLREVPLTWQDLLDPKEGDYMMQATVHARLNTELLWMLTDRYRARDDVAVFYDLKMLWGIPGLSQPCPDISVVPRIHDKNRDRQSFDVVKEGTRPCLIVEVVSPEYRDKDYSDLPRIYRRAGIAEYLIVDPGPTGSEAPLRLSGHRLDADGHYRPIEADARGRLYSATTDLFFGPDPVERRVVIEDAVNGEELLRPGEEAAARRAAEMRAAEEADARRALEIELERLRKALKRDGRT